MSSAWRPVNTSLDLPMKASVVSFFMIFSPKASSVASPIRSAATLSGNLWSSSRKTNSFPPSVHRSLMSTPVPMRPDDSEDCRSRDPEALEAFHQLSWNPVPTCLFRRAPALSRSLHTICWLKALRVRQRQWRDNRMRRIDGNVTLSSFEGHAANRELFLSEWESS